MQNNTYEKISFSLKIKPIQQNILSFHRKSIKQKTSVSTHKSNLQQLTLHIHTRGAKHYLRKQYINTKHISIVKAIFTRHALSRRADEQNKTKQPSPQKEIRGKMYQLKYFSFFACMY